MSAFYLILNWLLAALLVVLAVVFVFDLLRLYRLPVPEGDKGRIVRLERQNRWLYLLVVVILLVSRIGRLSDM